MQNGRRNHWTCAAGLSRNSWVMEKSLAQWCDFKSHVVGTREELITTIGFTIGTEFAISTRCNHKNSKKKKVLTPFLKMSSYAVSVPTHQWPKCAVGCMDFFFTNDISTVPFRKQWQKYSCKLAWSTTNSCQKLCMSATPYRTFIREWVQMPYRTYNIREWALCQMTHAPSAMHCGHLETRYQMTLAPLPCTGAIWRQAVIAHYHL